ncbi:MAG TPA: carboxypeptidase-like regulatory domain-containing protein, partial [Terriglobales bacterium]|nr:carboxypeptidase-like regulatory domain-containing protein [Terriglobales bacterium]
LCLPATAQEGVSVQQAQQNSSRRIPGEASRRMLSAMMGMVQATDDRTLPGTVIVLTSEDGKRATAMAGGDGIFRVAGLTPGVYSLKATLDGFEEVTQEGIRLGPGDVLAVELRLKATGEPKKRDREIASVPGSGGPSELPPYREISRRNMAPKPQEPEVASSEKNTVPRPNRWVLDYPEWDRYPGRDGEYPYVFGRWFDPFNRNKLKGDYPILGNNTFFAFTGTSTTALDFRRLYVPSNVASRRPGSEEFFGHGGQAFIAETVRLSFDLFHGDTSFKPIDWQIRITPAANVNQIWTAERGIVSPDVRNGTSRTDGHVGLQEAFAEVKLKDLSSNFDFISVRAGIQQFTSDFRGFIFSDEQPGLRLFGNLRNNRIQYNLAYFYLLEKNTNSGLNTFEPRDQQVGIANVYIQDFFAHGYTASFSYHFNHDQATLHYDDNGFLVRPAPIGAVTPHDIQAHYLGWSGSGHIGRLNVNHAFYQVLGHDQLNPIAGKRTDINGQFAAVELSIDKDWLRPRAAFLFSSGDRNPTDKDARGFDSIVEAESFAGGIFSFFNREGIRLTGTGVALTAPESFIPSLRSSKEEGQANFVNPGLFLWNAGLDADVTQNLKAITNFNVMRFQHTDPLEYLLFQSKIPSSVGLDYSIGFVYRPKLSDNMTFTSGISGFTPGAGLRKIYTGRTLVSAFSAIRFQF